MRAGWVVLGLLGVLLAACRGPGWQAGPSVLAPPRLVAAALSDPLRLADLEAFDPRAVPAVPPPERVRPCCAFGASIKTPVPAVTLDNLTDVEHLGPHEYNNGLITFQSKGVVLEKNALVYTCRGGFIDLAHVRDNADLTLFLATRIARDLPGGSAFDLPEDGARRRVVVRPLPPELVLKLGRTETAVLIAAYLAFRLSVWHEFITWYGAESVPGFSERVSAFSPEDLYSNVVGIRLAMGIVRANLARTREGYNHAVDAWIAAGLRRLGAVPHDAAKAAMARVDGVWWDSRKTVRDFALVRRRHVAIRPPIAPWLAPDACAGGAAHALDLPERVGDLGLEGVATIAFSVNADLLRGFPLPAAVERPLTLADFPALEAAVRRDGAMELGPGFDRPEPQPVVARGVPIL